MDRWTVTMRAERGAPSPYWGSLMHGMLLEKLPGPWGDRLHGDGARPFSQWVETVNGASFRWHLNVLDDALSEAIVPLLREGARWPCRHLQGDLVIEQAHRTHVPFREWMSAFFLREAAVSRMRLTFLTTTTHRTQGGYALFPSIDLIARSLRDRLCALQPDMALADDEALEQIVSRTRIVRYRLQSGSYALEGARIQGYTGHVDLSVKGPDALLRLADVLFGFAPWCGVGVKTALGMGACRAEPIEPRTGTRPEEEH